MKKYRNSKLLALIVIVSLSTFLTGCFDQNLTSTTDTNPAGGSSQNNINTSITAQPDTISTQTDMPVTINVLSNDIGLASQNTMLTIQSAANNGLVVINNDQTISYTPNSGYSGTDSFSYKISNNSGSSSTATVIINVGCQTNCLKSIALSWSPNPEPNIDGYFVYIGTSSGNYTDKYWVTTPDISLLLASGQHYIAISAVDTDKIESALSNEVAFSL